MACYHQITAYRSRSGRDKKTGKWPIVFNIMEGYKDLTLLLPCGRCRGCRLEQSRQWAIRCVHEASLHKDNCFITLTYNDEHLPKDGSLDKRNFILFMKKLRKKFGANIRFFQCGEYGDKLSRPHHHVCLFNFDFKDKKIWKTKRGIPLYRSPSLELLWPKGWSSVGNVTFESAAYVARYVMKKKNGKQELEHYFSVDKETGLVLTEKIPEYITMSRKPGIGKNWLEKFKSDVYPSDEIVVRHKFKMKPPRYYDNLYDIENPKAMKKIKARRKPTGKKLEQANYNNTDERLRVRETIAINKSDRLIRSYEQGIPNEKHKSLI